MNVKTLTAAAAMVSAVAIAIKQNEEESLPSVKGALEVRSSLLGDCVFIRRKLKKLRKPWKDWSSSIPTA